MRTWLPKRPKFIRHKRVESIIRAYFGPENMKGTKPEEWTLGDTDIRMVDEIERQGFWGFADSKKNVIRYWVGPKAKLQEVLFFFGHELGHLADRWSKEYRRDSHRNKELRADAYGWAAQEALKIALQALDGVVTLHGP